MNRTAMSAALFASVPAALAQPAVNPAQLQSRTNDIVAVMQGRQPAAEVFTAEFLAAVPEPQIRALSQQLTAQNGALIGPENLVAATAAAGTFVLRYERARVSARVQLEAAAPYRVAGLRITEVAPIGDTANAIRADFDKLPGKTGFALARLDSGGPVTLVASHPEQQLAIGSAFKLWVLDALAQDIADGKRSWADVTRLGLRSLPSGEMQDWPDGAAVTLETLATQMIAKSDNTATDTLIRLLGRSAIEQRVKASHHADPARMIPFLTTLELFTLKAGTKGEAAAYGAVNDADQAAILARMQPGLSPAAVDPAIFAKGMPVAIDSAEWFASSDDMVRVLDGLRRRADPRVMAILGVSPGMSADIRTRFGRTGFKGGSEPGVLNLSYVIEGKDGRWYALSASWNDPARPVDMPAFSALVARLIKQIP